MGSILEKAFRDARSLLTLNRDREYRALRQMLALQPGERLLDVGSGDGFWTIRFARHCEFVLGLEPNPELIGFARRHNPTDNIAYQTGVAESLPFADAAFDKVVSISSVEHFRDPGQGLIEMTRVLKPGGRLAISVDSLLPENSTPGFRKWHSERHFVTRYFSEEEILASLELAGLTVERKQTRQLFRSRLAARIREYYIRNARLLLIFFPLLYIVVRFADVLFADMHGQILIVTGRVAAPGVGENLQTP